MKTVEAKILLFYKGKRVEPQIPFDILLHYEDVIFGDILFIENPEIKITGFCYFDRVVMQVYDFVFSICEQDGQASKGDTVLINVINLINYSVTATPIKKDKKDGTHTTT